MHLTLQNQICEAKKWVKLQGEIDRATIVVGYLSIPLSVIHRSNRHKIKEDKADLNSTINQNDVIDI